MKWVVTYKLHKNSVYTGKPYATIQSMVAQRSMKSVSQIAFRLSQKDKKISQTTLRRRFKEVGVHSMKPTSKPLLTSGDILNKTPVGYKTQRLRAKWKCVDIDRALKKQRTVYIDQ